MKYILVLKTFINIFSTIYIFTNKKDILDNCGLSNVWTFQNINFNTEWVIAYVKLRLRDHFLQEWNSNLENFPKALNYRLYKQI
jgi:hypothetical protein